MCHVWFSLGYRNYTHIKVSTSRTLEILLYNFIELVNSIYNLVFGNLRHHSHLKSVSRSYYSNPIFSLFSHLPSTISHTNNVLAFENVMQLTNTIQ